MPRQHFVAFLFVIGISQAGQPHYAAHIRRTSYGIPHIQAQDYGSLGFGEGYAQAEDHLCSLADQVVKARGERAKYFGPGKKDEYLRSDIGMKALDLVRRAADTFNKQPKELRDWYDGYVAGYNQYLAETGKDKIGGWCRGADWVFPITTTDLLAYHQVYLLVISGFATQIATAEPPHAGSSSTAGTLWNPPDMASNGWGIGKDLSSAGRGMLIANPHYPWVGSSRFWEKHLEIPGKLDVYGVGLIGTPGVHIGFNKDVAWTHTVSAGKRFTVYSLDLVPGKPIVYRYGKEERALTSKRISVEMKQSDGSVKSVEHTVWFSHYGPVLNLPNLGWTNERAYAIRDVNWDNTTSAAQWLAMTRARSMKEFQEAHERYQGMPWVNTISTSKEGIAWYVDDASTPNLSAEAIALWKQRRKSDATASKLFDQGVVLLDGSDPRFEWKDDPGARSPGVVSFAHQPQLERTDYVFNANDSFWLANARSLINGNYSPLHGERATARSLRTRNNALTLSLQSPDKPAGTDKKFTLDELGDAILSNRSLAAELLKGELIDRCGKQASVQVNSETVDLKRACGILAAWNGRFDLDSRGAVLFREWLSQFAQPDFLVKGKLFAVDFNPADPVGTPRGLAPGTLALENLGRAVQVLQSRNLALDVPLGDLQYADKHGRHMPVHGGDGFFDGLMNVLGGGRNTTTLEPVDEPRLVKGSRFLTEKGYPIVRGSSFLMVLEFTDKGPNAKAFLTYSESGDPASPHFTDQTELFAKKQWRPILFEEQQIAADVKRDYKVVNTKSKSATAGTAGQ
ncbi:MAG: acylase [Acidobacteriota bacterium]|nr:acylase [Acidobacteriota bacterium]